MHVHEILWISIFIGIKGVYINSHSFFPSKDRVPFLMHDHNPGFLRRTTDIENKFPDKIFNQSSDFTWEELQSLNAGEWFINVRSNTFQPKKKCKHDFILLLKIAWDICFSDFPDRPFQLSVESLRRWETNGQESDHTLLTGPSKPRQGQQHPSVVRLIQSWHRKWHRGSGENHLAFWH